MHPPPDIYTEPPVSADTLAHLGPLRALAGTWEAQKGLDVSPKAQGPERKQFIERVRFDPIDAQTNGPQLLYGLRYHIHINNPEEKITFHDQVGYWLWEPASGLLLQSGTIPRGQAFLAAGKAEKDARRFSVEARRGAADYGIVSNDFLEQNFRTDRYRIEVTLHDDDSWSYRIDTTLMIRGREPFDHHDENRLRRVAGPSANPLAAG
ncbi:MAG: heme-binding beta-barrel domain-containing protein [Paracoccus sp. (in: a-proteobacteria)]|nr:heme-binding beta-barrel domain-containing protein [Paracoccus sp. (in: a-proteobacteria)]